MLKFDRYETLTFDCYGTLVDWESGMLAALKPLLTNHGIDLSETQILESFAEFEAEQEQGEYRKYREVLDRIVQQFGDRFRFTPATAEIRSLADSIQHWQPFPDTVAALKRLKQRFKLAIISNVDDDLFAATAQHLEVPFDYVITAEQAKRYKPSLHNFRLAIDKIGAPVDRILHVAGSIYHDIVPARSLGLATVWIDRRAGQGAGAAIAATGQADLEVPDLKTLADLSGAS